MHRIVTSGLIFFTLAGCSFGGQSIFAGLSGASSTQDITGSTTASLSHNSQSASGSSSKKLQRLALATDGAPKGTWERAPKGAFSDRDYSSSRLNPELARQAVNTYRKQNGLGALKLNSKLTIAAKGHSRDLAKWDRISHYGSDGSDPWDRVAKTGFSAKLAAENVGTGQTTLDEVMKGWKKSPGHNKNLLLKDATHMGIALVRDPKTEFKTFWTLVLGTPL